MLAQMFAFFSSFDRVNQLFSPPAIDEFGIFTKTNRALQFGLTFILQIKNDAAASRNKKDGNNALPSRVSHLQALNKLCLA